MFMDEISGDFLGFLGVSEVFEDCLRFSPQYFVTPHYPKPPPPFLIIYLTPSHLLYHSFIIFDISAVISFSSYLPPSIVFFPIYILSHHPLSRASLPSLTSFSIPLSIKPFPPTSIFFFCAPFHPSILLFSLFTLPLLLPFLSFHHSFLTFFSIIPSTPFFPSSHPHLFHHHSIHFHTHLFNHPQWSTLWTTSVRCATNPPLLLPLFPEELYPTTSQKSQAVEVAGCYIVNSSNPSGSPSTFEQANQPFIACTNQSSHVPINHRMYQSIIACTNQSSHVPINHRMYQSIIACTNQSSLVPINHRLYQPIIFFTNHIVDIPTKNHSTIFYFSLFHFFLISLKKKFFFLIIVIFFFSFFMY